MGAGSTNQEAVRRAQEESGLGSCKWATRELRAEEMHRVQGARKS